MKVLAQGDSEKETCKCIPLILKQVRRREMY
jgi:hypothetical protein